MKLKPKSQFNHHKEIRKNEILTSFCILNNETGAVSSLSGPQQLTLKRTEKGKLNTFYPFIKGAIKPGAIQPWAINRGQ